MTPERAPILCLSQSFAPATTPTAIRAGKLLGRIAAERDVVVLTESEGARSEGRLRVEHVRSRRPGRLLGLIRRIRMQKLLELLLWPDDSIFWVLPAIRAGRRLIRERRPEAIVVFMMPYSSGLAGLALSRLSGLPLILNLDDSPTCTDMHPHFPTRLHARLARALEDRYIRRADAVVYVSETNMRAVTDRQPDRERAKLRLVRYGADRAQTGTEEPADEGFEIVYVGAMSGWWSLIGEQDDRGGIAARAFEAWRRLGRFERLELDQSTSSPAVVGRAILRVIGAHPEWAGRVSVKVHGNPYPEDLIARALESAGVQSVVTVLGPVPHEQIAGILARADLLFLTLPRRVDGSAGGRISAKTYEYLATDRPILAAVPRGENWSYLEGRPGVWLVEPDDREGMERAIVELAGAKFAGRPLRFEREELRSELSYETRAREFGAAIDAAVAARGA